MVFLKEFANLQTHSRECLIITKLRVTELAMEPAMLEVQ